MKTAATETPRVQIILPAVTTEENPGAFVVPGTYDQMVFEVDGQIVSIEPLAAAPVFVEELMEPGTYHVRVYLSGKSRYSYILLADQVTDFGAGDVLRIQRQLAYR